MKNYSWINIAFQAGFGGWRGRRKNQHRGNCRPSRQRVGRRNCTNCGLAQLHPIHTAFNGPSVVPLLCCCCYSCTKDDDGERRRWCYFVSRYTVQHLFICDRQMPRCVLVACVSFSLRNGLLLCFTSQATGYVNLPAYYLSSRCIFGEWRGDEWIWCNKAIIVCSTWRGQTKPCVNFDLHGWDFWGAELLELRGQCSMTPRNLQINVWVLRMCVECLGICHKIRSTEVVTAWLGAWFGVVWSNIGHIWWD